METWIINESNEITGKLQECLRDLDIDCPSERIVCAHEATDLIADNTKSNQMFFLTADAIEPYHLEILRHLRSSGEGKIIVVSTVTQSDDILRLFRAGASDLLMWRKDVRQEIARLVSRLRLESCAGNRNGKVISVVPSSTTCDSNLLSLSLAAAIAEATKDCGLVDLHLRGGNLAAMLKIDPPHTLLALLTQRDGVDQTMVEQAMATHPSGIRLLASPPMFSHLADVQTQHCQSVLNHVRATRPCTVINTDDAGYAEQLSALKSSDAVILTTRLDFVSVARAKETMQFLSNHHVDSTSLHVVAMHTGHTGELPAKSVRKILGVPKLTCLPADPIATLISLNLGNPLILESPNSPLAKAIHGLARSIPDLCELGLSASGERQRSRERTFEFFSDSLLPRLRMNHLHQPAV